MKVQHKNPLKFDAKQVERITPHGHVYYKIEPNEEQQEVEIYKTSGGIPIYGIFGAKIEVGDWRIDNYHGERYFLSDTLFKAQFVPVKQNHEQHTPPTV